MITCLSPNGRIETSGQDPADTLMVATLQGIHTLKREGPDHPWQPGEVALADKHISSLLYEPVSDRLFAGCHGYGEAGGLYSSSDGGQTWSRCMEGIENEHIYTVTAEERDGDVILYAGTEPPAFYRSHDLGQSWQELPGIKKVPGTDKWTFPPPPHIAHVKWATTDPKTPGRIYVLVEQGALLRSDDDGANWHELDAYSSENDSFYRDVHRVAISRQNPKRLFLATGDGLYGSSDDGASWEHLQGREDRVGYPDALYIDPNDDNTLYMGGAADAPETWRAEGGAFPGFIVSHDGGRTWHESMNGLPQPIEANIEAMVMHYWPQGTAFYAGTAVGDIFGTEDGGNTWQKIASGLPPVSKARHYRHFLSAEEKARIEGEARSESVNAGR